MRRVPWIRFFVSSGLGFLLVWGGFALWIMLAPLSILDVGQTELVAKDVLLRRCGPAKVVVFGDSRADYAVDPAALDVPVLNLAQTGASPMADYYRLRTLLACASKPDLVILSYIMPEYVRMTNSGFWGNAVFSHMLRLSEREEIIAAIKADGGPDIYHPLTGEEAPGNPGVPATLKDILYQLYFPPLYGATALQSLQTGIILREHQNSDVYQAILLGTTEARSFPHDNAPGKDAGLWTGRANPAIDGYVRRMLSLLEDQGIASVIMLMPVNDATYYAMSAPVREAILRYLQELVRQYPHSSLADLDLPHWPDRFFGDEFYHVNAAGTAEISAILNRCLGAAGMASGGAGASRCSLAVPLGAGRVTRIARPGG